MTPHALSIKDENGSILNIPASGTVARCSQKNEVVGKLEYSVLLQDPETKETKSVTLSIPITKVTLGDVQDMPEPKYSTVYCVSRVVADALKGRRDDIVIPGPAIRDSEGNIIGADGVSVV